MGAVIDWLTWLVRILWACRVSVINVVSSCILFFFAVQAQDLMMDLSSAGSWLTEIAFWAGVLLLTFFLWAFPVHYGARRTLAEDSWIIPRATRDELSRTCRDEIVVPVRDRYGYLIVGIPRLLGLGPFVALGIGIWYALGAIGGAQALEETRQAQSQGLWLGVTDAVMAALFVLFVYLRCKLLPAHWDGRVLHPLALLGTSAIFVVAYVFPVWTSVHLPRAMLVPPLFGSLVLFTSWLQRLGHRTGVPFLLGLFVVAGLLTAANVTFDDLRKLPGQVADQRLSMDEAVARWKEANGCAKGGCPHPIVVAIDGGASRAAFTAATFVGELLDSIAGNEPAQSDEAASPGRRLFAISGVSGGSYGAAVIQAAIADAQGETPSARPPCRSARTTWFGFDDWQRGGNAFTWRQCLQALTSGDSLSPTIIGLAFRDFAAPPWQRIPGVPAMADRAALLEMTWERQYSAILTPGLTVFLGGDSCAEVEPGGLCRRMAHPEAFFKAPHAGKVWMPMLLLNGTSVATGRRIIAADLRSVADPNDQANGGALYPQAYDLREAMSSPCPGTPTLAPGASAYATKTLADATQNERTLLSGVCRKQPAPIDGPDVRLSTAALTSARFPVISPAGIFDMNAARYGDQVVDGGYFENSGLTSALEIVAALRARGIDPILVSIANDPQYAVPNDADLAACAARYGSAATPRDTLARCSGLPRRPAPTPLVLPDDNTFVGRLLGLAWRPIEALSATRDGHADEAMGRAEALFPLPKGGFFQLKVEVAPDFGDKPDLPLADDQRCATLAGKTLEMAKVSMSWWLSAAVQADLDVQRCSLDNRGALKKIEAAIAARDATR